MGRRLPALWMVGKYDSSGVPQSSWKTLKNEKSVFQYWKSPGKMLKCPGKVLEFCKNK